MMNSQKSQDTKAKHIDGASTHKLETVVRDTRTESAGTGFTLSGELDSQKVHHIRAPNEPMQPRPVEKAKQGASRQF